MAVALFVYGLVLASFAVLAVWGAFVLGPENGTDGGYEPVAAPGRTSPDS